MLSRSSLNVNTGNRANTDEIVHITEQTLHTVIQYLTSQATKKLATNGGDSLVKSAILGT